MTTNLTARAIGLMETSALENLLDADALTPRQIQDITAELKVRELEASLPAAMDEL